MLECQEWGAISEGIGSCPHCCATPWWYGALPCPPLVFYSRLKTLHTSTPYLPQTLENTREADVTMVMAGDEEVAAEEEQDEFAGD
jgi:hypothetical protein